MRARKTVLVLAVAFCGFAAAQKKAEKLPPPAPSPSIVIEETSWPLPLKERDEFRDRQHEYDQIEIENQKMLLNIEKNKALQRNIVDEESSIASTFARSKNLDLSQFELDPAKVVLRKKKAK